MSYTFTCPHCSVVSHVDSSFLGETGECRECGMKVTVIPPTPEKPAAVSLTPPRRNPPASRGFRPIHFILTVVVIMAICRTGFGIWKMRRDQQFLRTLRDLSEDERRKIDVLPREFVERSEQERKALEQKLMQSDKVWRFGAEPIPVTPQP